MEAAFQSDGWALNSKGFEYCKAICANKNPPRKDIILNALHTDIREIGAQSLPADVNKAHNSEIQGPIVLQIQKVKNISAPNAKEDSSFAPRMLRLTMTDGVITCSGIEMETINAISLLTPPGSKICLLGTITIQHGFLLLDSKNLKFLGGEVDHLKTKWEISKNVSKIQRKVLTAEGGPPLFVPFEDSDFAKRKPQGPSVTIKHVESFKQKGKPPAKQTETSSKPFDEKKIWKSEPKKDKITKPYKDGGSNERERPENRKQTPQTEAKPSKSRETDRVVNKKNYDGREQRGGVKDFKDSKDSSYNKQHSKGTKREEEKGKGRNAEREEKRGSVDYSNNSRYVKPDAKATGGKENSNGAKFGGREGYDSRPGQKQRGNFPHERSENFNRKSARHEENSHLSKNSLPPRLERLKQLKVDNAEEYNQQDFKKEKKPSDLAGTEKDARAKNHVEDDMKRVTDLLNERMKIDEKKMDNDRNRGQRDNSFRDRNYRKSDFNPNQSRRDNNRERNMYGGGRGRIGTEERQKEQRIQEGRGRGRQYGPDERERRNPQRSSGGREVGYQERSYQVQERVAVDSQERGGFTGRGRRYDGGQARHGGRGQTGPRSFNPRESPEESKLENDRDKMPTQQVKDDVMQQTDRRILNPPPHETKEMDLQENRPNSSKYKNDIGVPIESEIQLTEDTDKPDKFKEFLNSVIHNNCVGGDYRLMQQQILSDSNIPQTSMQQPMITPSGQLMYNYMPSYPTAMYHPNIQQGYQNVANQEFQQPGGYQSGIHSMQQISQYQQPVVSTLAQEYRYMPTLAPQSMRFQSQGMQPGGQQTRPRPRVRHDVYRPKHN